MSEETLLSAARRVARFFRIDEAHGGLTSRDTLIAVITLDKEIERETKRIKALDATAQSETGAAADHGVDATKTVLPERGTP